MHALRLLPLVLVGFAGLAALAACDTLQVFPPEGAVRADDFSLTADRASYDSGDEVTLTLRNEGDRPGEMGVLYCALLERRTEAGWEQSPDGNGRACIAILVTVGPGEATTAEVPLDGVPDGTYRYTHRVSGAAVATASFEVR